MQVVRRTVAGGENIGTAYIPINLSSVRVDSVTKFDLYFQPQPGQPLVLYSEKNVRFTEAARQRLIGSKVSRLYIPKQDQVNYCRYVEANLPDILSDTLISITEKTDILYTSTSVVAEALLTQPEAPENVKRSRQAIRHTVDYMLDEGHAFAHFLKAISSVYEVYTHCVNVMTYSVALAQRVGYNDPASLREIGIGALLHDLGKSKIPASILYSPHSLTDEQMELVKMHPRFGHDMLANASGVGEIALDIVLHHHERTRGTGYPDGLSGSRISPFTHIVGIADCFDALTTERPFQRARNSFGALTYMRNMVPSEYDPTLFRAFVGMLGNPAM